MKLSLILAAGALAIGTVAAGPADAQGWHGHDRGRQDWRGGGYRHGGYGYRRGWHGGYRGRLVCRYRHGLRRCFRV